MDDSQFWSKRDDFTSLPMRRSDFSEMLGENVKRVNIVRSLRGCKEPLLASAAHFHMQRHGFGQTLFNLGASPTLRGMLMRHADPRSDAPYTSHTSGAVREHAEDMFLRREVDSEELVRLLDACNAIVEGEQITLQELRTAIVSIGLSPSAGVWRLVRQMEVSLLEASLRGANAVQAVSIRLVIALVRVCQQASLVPLPPPPSAPGFFGTARLTSGFGDGASALSYSHGSSDAAAAVASARDADECMLEAADARAAEGLPSLVLGMEDTVAHVQWPYLGLCMHDAARFVIE